MLADVSVHEPKQTEDPESALAFTMEGRTGEQPGSLLPYVWSPGWNSNQSLHKFQSEVGGALSGGTCGVRVLDAASGVSMAPAIADTNANTTGHWLLLARHQAFGSDELSMQTATIAEVAGLPRIYITQQDADALNVAAGDGVILQDAHLEVHIDDTLADGCAAFSIGHPQTQGIFADQSVTLSRDESWVRAQADVIISDRQGASHV